MAKSAEERKASLKSTTTTQAPKSESTTTTSTPNESPSGASLDEIMKMLNSLNTTVASLSAELATEREKNAQLTRELDEANKSITVESIAPANITAPNTIPTSDSLDRLAEALSNRKSDKEVVVVHNRTLIGGAATSIRLTNLSIDFHTLGEERVLSYQQFEELVSKYHKWFDKEIILLAPGYEELAERYNVPCQKRTGHAALTKSDLQTIHRLNERELEDYMSTLTEQDQEFICSYWLGMCYQKDERFLNRSKIELLNRITGKGIFNVFLVDMNFNSITH